MEWPFPYSLLTTLKILEWEGEREKEQEAIGAPKSAAIAATTIANLESIAVRIKYADVSRWSKICFDHVITRSYLQFLRENIWLYKGRQNNSPKEVKLGNGEGKEGWIIFWLTEEDFRTKSELHLVVFAFSLNLKTSLKKKPTSEMQQTSLRVDLFEMRLEQFYVATYLRETENGMGVACENIYAR